MTTAEPPNLREEEEGSFPASTTIKSKLTASHYRFSITRLIIATAMAPLPLLLFNPNQPVFATFFGVSCCTLFGAVLFTRARDLPRLNLGVTLMLVPAYLGTMWSRDWPIVPSLATLFALPAMNCARNYFPVSREEDRLNPKWSRFVNNGALVLLGFIALLSLVYLDLILLVFSLVTFGLIHESNPGSQIGERVGDVPTCRQIFTSGAFLYLSLNALSYGAIDLFFQRGTAAPVFIVWVGAVILASLLPLNVYWLATCPRENLDRRPGLGFLFELTMVLIPLAVLFFLIRSLHP